MTTNTKIEWTDHTFNAWMGCSAVSSGCANCYAEALSVRTGRDFKNRVRTSQSYWRTPLKWQAQAPAFWQAHGRRQRVFCCSLADVFDNEVDPQWRTDLFELIAKTPDLDWQLLTKRIGNARAMLNQVVDAMSHGLNTWDERPWPNVWLGSTIVNQDEADRDIPKLLATPAAIRFLSLEPLLGPVDLTPAYLPCPRAAEGLTMDPQTGSYECCRQCDYTGVGDEVGIDWAIVGGESGPGARPMSDRWARDLRDQCAAAGVPFFFKQWGEWTPTLSKPSGTPGRYAYGDWRYGSWEGGNAFTETDQYPRAYFTFGARAILERVGKKAAGRLLDGVIHNAFPGG